MEDNGNTFFSPTQIGLPDVFLLWEGTAYIKKGFQSAFVHSGQEGNANTAHLRVGDRIFFVYFVLFSFLSSRIQKYLLDLFPLAYLWCKNAVRFNVHLEGLSWRSWAREFVMGTNDGFRNFSANCDLERKEYEYR